MEDEILNKTKFNLSDFFKENKSKFILIISLVIISVFITIIFKEYKKKQITKISEKYNKAKILVEKNNINESLKLLEEVLSSNNSFYSPSALNLIIDNNMIKDKQLILNYFEKILTDSGIDKETKNLFVFKKIIYLGDEISENDLLNALNPIIQSDSLYKNTVSDYVKKYYLSKGEFNKAKEFEISKNN